MLTLLIIYTVARFVKAKLRLAPVPVATTQGKLPKAKQ